VPSSSVSRRIKDLEIELGAALFERTTRTVRLTDLGYLYLGEIGPALQSIELADELVGTQSRITAMPGYGERFVLPALEKLRGQYENIDFDLNFTDQVINLASNEVDIAIRAASKLPDQVVARRLGDHDFVLVATPNYIAKYGAPTTSSELRHRSVFMYRTPYGILEWLVLQNGIWRTVELNPRRTVELNPKYITTHGQSLLNSVLDGHGISYLPSWGVAEDIKAGNLVALELEDGPLSTRGDAPLSTRGDAQTGVYLLYHPPKFRLQKIRVAVDFLVAELKHDTLAV